MQVRATIDRFEEDSVVLITTNNKKIIWPRENLDPRQKEGDIIVFIVTDDAGASEENNEKAKNILNEILDVDDE